MNADVLYGKIMSKFPDDERVKPGLQFRRAIAKALIGNYNGRSLDSRIGRKRPRPTDDDHQVIKCEFRGRCHLCSTKVNDKRTVFKCRECDVFLCFTKDRNCFQEHHAN